jgi:hypothetical protein
MGISFHFPTKFFADWNTLPVSVKQAFRRFMAQIRENPEDKHFLNVDHKTIDGETVFFYQLHNKLCIYYTVDREDGIFIKAVNCLMISLNPKITKK